MIPWLKKYQRPLVAGSLGLALALGGVFLFLSRGQTGDKVEIIPSTAEISPSMMTIDVEGAVEKPGVYSLASGSRLDDLLIAAGGLSVKADREWIQRNLNRAQKLTDGTKIYLPTRQELVGSQTTQSAGSVLVNTTTNSAKVNINTASASQLEGLWGIGPATAKQIIDGRPYGQVEELLQKKILKSNVYQKVADQLTAY